MSLSVTIKRITYTKHGTFGVMLIDGFPMFVTLEEPDNNNAKGISCIPTGEYKVIPHDSPKFPNTYHVTGVKGRDAILIHSGNTIQDTEGCILVGTSYSTLGQLPSIAGSKDALNKFRSIAKRDNFTLTIKDYI